MSSSSVGVRGDGTPIAIHSVSLINEVPWMGEDDLGANSKRRLPREVKASSIETIAIFWEMRSLEDTAAVAADLNGPASVALP